MYLDTETETTSVKIDCLPQAAYNQVFVAAPKQFKLCQWWNNLQNFPSAGRLEEEKSLLQFM